MANGLLDFIQTPAGVGLLSAVATGFANARRGTPFNNIGRGVAGGLMGYSSAKDAIAQEQENAFNKQFKQFQMDKMKREMEREQATQAWQAGLPEALKKTKEVKTPFQADDAFNEGIGNGLFNAEQVPDMQARQDYLMRPESPYAGKLIEQQLFPKGPEYKVVGDSLVAIGDEGAKPVYTAEPKAPSAVQEYKFAQDQGYQGSFDQWKKSNARAGATNIVNKIDNKTGESLAGQIGPMAKDSRTRAMGAIKMADSAERLEKALGSGNVIAGPFASKRMFLNQIGAQMGITGPDSVTQTRQVIRALAESSVEARKELQGQGQVTENEAKAVEKAMSGNIDEMTVPELKALVSLNKKAAKFSVEQHKYLLDEMNQNPGLQGVSKFYDVPGMDRVLQYKFDATGGGFSDADKERRYQEWKARQGK